MGLINMTWKDILKSKTEKPTKLVDSYEPEFYDRDGPAFGHSQNIHGQHFNNCNRITGKNPNIEISEEGEEREYDNCNCHEIAKDWYKESEFVRDTLEDMGVGTLDSSGRSSVHIRDGTDWEELEDEVQKDMAEYTGGGIAASPDDPTLSLILLTATALGVGVNELRQSGKLKEISDKIKGRFKVISNRKKL
jgi:hypothetical protein